MIYRAYELRARFDAGLMLCGQNEDGELEWIGTDRQRRHVQLLEDLSVNVF